MPSVSGVRRLMLLALRTAVVAYVLICAALFVFQEKLIYFPTRQLMGTPREVGLEYQQVRVPVGNGETISAWVLSAEQPRGYVIFCHGNGGNISHRLEAARLLLRLGMTTLLFDYRGYGDSSGTPSEERTYQDARAVWNYAMSEAGFDPARTVIWGESLGGAVASLLAAEQDAAALVLQSTFTSVSDVAADAYPLLPARLLVRIKYPTIERLPSITEPVLVIHSPQDEVIPFALGHKLFAAASEPRQMLVISGDHNSGLFTSRATTEPGVSRFLDEHVGKSEEKLSKPRP